jgi:hypothetical protein
MFFAMASISSAYSQSPAQFQELNILVGRGRHIEAAAKVIEYPAKSPGLVSWLEGMANAGVVPLAYELARRLAREDPNAAINWYAVGYVGHRLARSECTNNAPNPKDIFLSATYGNLSTIALDNPSLFVSALERALAWEYMRKYIHDASWLCEITIPDGRARAAARNEQAIKLRSEIDDLKRKTEMK